MRRPNCLSPSPPRPSPVRPFSHPHQRSSNSGNLTVRVRPQPFILITNPPDGLVTSGPVTNLSVNGVAFAYDTFITNVGGQPIERNLPASKSGLPRCHRLANI
ncbi:hypothetical protein SBV1_270028 [Verrucomicrobia bacterium]|nr:hypothetical protein SBV1_270028 [Verrucomicrobiota bacterium]